MFVYEGILKWHLNVSGMYNITDTRYFLDDAHCPATLYGGFIKYRNIYVNILLL